MFVKSYDAAHSGDTVTATLVLTNDYDFDSVDAQSIVVPVDLVNGLIDFINAAWTPEELKLHGERTALKVKRLADSTFGAQ